MYIHIRIIQLFQKKLQNLCWNKTVEIKFNKKYWKNLEKINCVFITFHPTNFGSKIFAAFCAVEMLLLS